MPLYLSPTGFGMEAFGKKDACHFNLLITKSVPHILEKIFFSLDYVSYSKCAAVSTKWNKLLSSERFQRLKKDVFREDIEKELMHALRRRNTNPHPFHKYGCYAPDTNKIRKLVSNDLVFAKDFALNNILQTQYKQIEEASYYNL